MTTPFFNAHHSPLGAFATLTLGMPGSKGGLGIELTGPARRAFYAGLEERDEPGHYKALPFFAPPRDTSDDYDVEHISDFTARPAMTTFERQDIVRHLGAGIDEWKAGDLTLRLVSFVGSVPDPDTASESELKDAIAPYVLIEMTVDNRSAKNPRRAFVGYEGPDPSAGMRVISEPGLVGIAQHNTTGIASDDPAVYAGLGFQLEKVLAPQSPENLQFLVGNIGLLVGVAQPGELRTFRFAVGFFREGTATSGMKTRYLYRRFFNDLEEVLRHGLLGFEATVAKAKRFDLGLSARLSPARAFMAGHAIRSYFGSTQLLEREDGRPLWVLNEGEYRMMNTLDLTVDVAYFELVSNPWTVRNVLDAYVERYAYEDEVVSPDTGEHHAGGLAFTHDMGVSNTFSRPGYSGYEQSHVRGCFSYMSAEELMNWVLTASLYLFYTNDIAWAVSQRKTFLAALESLVNRDHPDPANRNGLIGLDGARCEGGSEITTYDSLDPSLGRARKNLYLGVKGWATYLALRDVLRRLSEAQAVRLAGKQVELAVLTITGAARSDGTLPALIGEKIESRIIPAIEGLVYPYVLGLPIDERMLAVLKRHYEAVMKPGTCVFPDGGWKLSSASGNSWLSKIYLCQFVAEAVLGHKPDEAADCAHVGWLLQEGNAFYAWSDQMLNGKAVGSRYYPRGVTSILMAAKGDQPLSSLEPVFNSPCDSLVDQRQ